AWPTKHPPFSSKTCPSTTPAAWHCQLIVCWAAHQARRCIPPSGSDPLCGGSPRDLVPHLKLLSHALAIRVGREPVTSRSEVLGNGTIGVEEPLGLSGRLAPLHPSFALTRRLMGMLGAMIEIAVLPMFHARQEISLGGSITLQLIRDDDPWSIL